MRVAYLVNQYPKVSHSFIRREILALERQGFEIARVSIRGWNLDLADPIDEAERTKTTYVLKQGIFVVLLSFLRMALTHPIRLIRALTLTLEMLRQSDRHLLLHMAYLAEACWMVPWMNKMRIEHLHAHFGTNSADVAMLAHELGGPTWSFTVHGPEEFDRKLVICLAQKVKRSAFVVAISSFGRAQLYRLVDQSYWPKIHVVHCGIDTNFEAIPEQITQLSRRFICVGRLCEQKGQLLLLEAAKQLLAKGIECDVVLAGDGDMRHLLEKFIHLNNLATSVRITGWISGKKVRQEITAARALVLPSFAEGLPVVIMETMASERPVISTYVAGIPELVRNGQDGWLVPAGDVDELVRVMEACLVLSDASILAMGASARAQVLERHSIDREATRLATLFEMTSHSAQLRNAS